MSDKKIKHFVFMRFFNEQSPKYPYNILDVDFLSEQIVLAKNNSLSSLENQTNKNFEVVFILHEKAFLDNKYEFIFSGLQNATTLSLKFIKWNEQSLLVNEALNEYDFVIQSRMDLDDFIYKEAVKDIHSKVINCDSILSYGYCKGYTYACGEICSYYHPFNNEGWIGIMGSLILKSSFAKNMPFISVHFNHTKVKPAMKTFLEKNHVEFKENMFQQNTSTNAFIYFRSEFSRWIYEFGSGKVYVLNRNRITEGITKKQLQDEFGFSGYELKSIE